MNDIQFREAALADVPLILRFIRDLARYEKLEHEVVADEAVLKEWLFERKSASVFFAMYEGTEAGFALYFYNFSTFLGHGGIYLEDLYVKPEYRGKGIGTAIFHHLAKIACAQGCGRLEWWCLDWNRPSIDFYLSLGAEAMDEWTVYRISGDTLKRMGENHNF